MMAQPTRDDEPLVPAMTCYETTLVRLNEFRRQEEGDAARTVLSEMEQVVPWAALRALIEPHYRTAGRPGRQPMPSTTMLRVHLLQQWYARSDLAMGDALYEIESMRRFAGVELNEDAIPDETTILKFRRFLEEHDLGCSRW